MKRKIIILLFALFFSAGQSQAQSRINKGIPPGYARLTSYADGVRGLMKTAQTDSSFQVDTIGSSSVRKIPLYVCEVSHKKPSAEPLKVMILGSIHGSEPAGFEALLIFLSKMADGSEKNRSIYLDNLELYIVPCVNPEGLARAHAHYRETGGFWSKEGRYNDGGFDLNRDYHSISTSEIKSILRLYNRIRPEVVIDLHEYSSIPIVVSGSGWWQAACFDVTVGAGRHPDVYGPLASYALEVTENEIFRNIRKAGYRAEYYTISSGNVDSTGRMAVNGADYFNLRNSLTFLVETAAYDRGESNLKRRTEIQLSVLRIILDRLSKDRDKIKKIVADAEKFSLERTAVTLSLELIPTAFLVNEKKMEKLQMETKINIEGKSYRSVSNVRFRKGNPQKAMKIPVPRYYIVLTDSAGLIDKLLLHGAAVLHAREPIETDDCTIPAGAFIIPARGPSSAIIGLLLDNRSYAANAFPIKERALVFSTGGPVDTAKTKPIETPGEIREAVARTAVYLLQKNKVNKD